MDANTIPGPTYSAPSRTDEDLHVEHACFDAESYAQESLQDFNAAITRAFDRFDVPRHRRREERGCLLDSRRILLDEFDADERYGG